MMDFLFSFYEIAQIYCITIKIHFLLIIIRNEWIKASVSGFKAVALLPILGELSY